MRRSVLTLLTRGVPAALALALAAGGTALAAHPDGQVIRLRDATGAVISVANGNTDQPYSPKQTCGTCHDYDTITAGYHFQQGFDELIADAERTAGERPFVKSPGMYGKW